MKLKNKFYWMAVIIMAGLLSSLWFLVQSKADDPDTKPDNQVFLPLIGSGDNAANASAVTPQQITVQANGVGGWIDGFTYFIPFPADTLDDQFEAGASNPPPPRVIADFTNVDIITTISIAILRDGSIIYYDHWEDGYEDNLTSPTQPSTQVWGDNDPSNGIPPGFASDALSINDVITLQSTIDLPRDLNDTVFDGGDVLTSVGGITSVAMTFWPQDPPGVRYADAWELYPTSRWGTDYQIPIGENVSRPSTAQTGTGTSFDIVGLYVQAVQDGTTVDIDLNNDGTTDKSGTINQGQTFDVLANNLIGVEGPPTADSVLAGARVHASAPVQIMLFTNNPIGRWEARGYTMVPTDQWVGDYMYPRSSDGDYWLFNPNNSDLTVNVALSGGATDSLVVPANSTAKYPPAGLLGVTGVRFTASSPFYGVAAFDAGDTQDWGSALIPFENLTTQVLVGLGPGNSNNPSDGDESPVYVTAANATTIHVIFSDGSTTDISINALEETPITDPNNNMSGALLFTDDGTPFIAVWGQDQNAPGGTPSIDAGTSISPLRSLTIQKTFDMVLDQDCNGIISVRDTVQFKLDYFDNAATTINNINVEDILPSALSYVPGTTTLNGAPIADGGGSTPFILDEGGFNAGILAPRSVGSITYETTVNDTSNPIINRANVDAPRVVGGIDDASIVIPAGSASPVMEITTALVDPADGVVSPGQTITVNLIITNTSVSSTVVELPVEYRFNASQLGFAGASTAPDTVNGGVLTWNDLAPLAPGQAVNILLNFTVNQIPAGNSTIFTALINDARRDNSIVLLRCQAETSAPLAGPSTPTPTPTQTLTPTPTSTPLTSTPTPTPKPSKGGDSKSTPSPSNPPTPTPVMVAAIPAATPTPGLPVLFLPETGTKETEQKQEAGNLIVVLAIITIGAAAVWFWLKTKQVKGLLPSGKDK